MEKNNVYWNSFKSFVLYSLSLDKNEYVNSIQDECFSPHNVSNSIAAIREKLDAYHGIILKRNGLDDFSIEDGIWDKGQYIQSWSYFIVFFTLDSEKSVTRLYDAIIRYSQATGLNPFFILDSLWQEGWIIHRMNYAQLYYNLLDTSNRGFDVLMSIYDKVLSDLEYAKKQSKNLDEWANSQFHLVALVSAGQMLADAIHNTESEKYSRYFEEVKADLIEFFSVCSECVFSCNPFFIIEYYAPLNAETEKYKKELKFRHKSRVHMPKYWFELALSFTEVSDISNESFWLMTQFDAISLLGMFFQISPQFMRMSFELSATGKIKVLENEKIVL